MINAEELRRIVHYDPETGIMTHRVKLANRTKVGSEVGWLDKSPKCGYRRVTIKGETYLVHRLAWLYVYGEWPDEQLDHINRVRIDNRISNLRDVTNQENQFNTSKNSNKSVPYVGVYYHKANRKWTAAISWKKDGKKHQKYLGSFETPEMASAAYLQAKSVHHVVGI